ncbi:MAG: mechanosensitive ion channel domain-containing protein [Saprospiraceae bacterium]
MEQVYLMSALKVAGIVLAALVVALLVRGWVLGRLDRVAGGRPQAFAAVVREDLGTPSILWCLAIAVDTLLRTIQLSPANEHLGHALLVSFLILSLTMVASSVLMRAIHLYGEQHKLPFAVAGLSRTLTRALVFSVGLLVLLRFLGISITPVLTALGVGGLAVALALQDTLANLFAGVHVLVERPIAVGDFIRLSAEEEGMVSDIGWRTTRLVTGANNTVVIPNKTITSGNLLNYSMPSIEVGVSVPVILGMEADVDKAEKIAVAAAVAAEGVLAVPPPAFVADPGMTPTHLQYKLAFRIARHTQSGAIRTLVVKGMLAGFRKNGIPLPEARLK